MNVSQRLEFVVAGDTRHDIERDCGELAWRQLADNGFVERTTVGCVGFYREIKQNSLLVVLPKAFSSPVTRERLKDPVFRREHIYRLIRVFRKVRRETEFSLAGGFSNQKLNREAKVKDPVLDAFDGALQIRRDFKMNGLYVRKSNRKTFNKPNLPVNWSRTIRSAKTILSNGEVFFDNTVHFERKRDLTHPLCLLQIACLKEIFELTGERTDLNELDSLEPDFFRRIKARPRAYLRELRNSTFDERGRNVISMIGAYLSESSMQAADRKVKEELLSYTKDFENIWEKILRDLMAPGMNTRALPAGEWYGWPDASEKRGMQPEYDVRLETEGEDVIVDAKDYRFFNGSKWQGTNSDHYKQIIYRQLLASPKGSNAVNILAFPSIGQKSLFLIRGCHRWKEIENSCVFEVTVDYDLAVNRWLREIPLDIKKEIDDLISDIKIFIKKLGIENK